MKLQEKWNNEFSFLGQREFDYRELAGIPLVIILVLALLL